MLRGFLFSVPEVQPWISKKVEPREPLCYHGEMISTSLKETEAIAKKFLDSLKQGGEATVVGLRGNLGSGKTTFVQCVAKILGVHESVTSPTFVLVKTYPLNAKRYTLLIHIDAYRLERGEELLKLGWNDLAKNPDNLILLEWPERVADILPQKNYTEISFEFVDDVTRKIEGVLQ